MVWDGTPLSLFEDLLSFINRFWSISHQKWMYCKIFFLDFFLRPSLHIRICEIHHHDVGSSHAHLSSLSSFFLLDKIETFKQFYLESRTADLLKMETERLVAKRSVDQKISWPKRSVDQKIKWPKDQLIKRSVVQRSVDQKISWPKDQLIKKSVDKKISWPKDQLTKRTLHQKIT